MDDLVLDSIHKLKDTKLVECETDDDGSELVATEFGEIMSKVSTPRIKFAYSDFEKYYVCQGTVSIIGLSPQLSMSCIKTRWLK